MSRVNHNAQYIYDFEGETVWEKLRNVRNQVKDRKLAYNLAVLNQEKLAQTEDKTSFEYREKMLYQEQVLENMQDCFNEIEFLTQFEQALATEAEKTRIPGKTDDEMYEINFFDELKLRLVRSAEAQLLSCGRLEENTIKRIMKNKSALQLCVQKGLLSHDAIKMASDNLLPGPDNYVTLHLENLKKEEKEK